MLKNYEVFIVITDNIGGIKKNNIFFIVKFKTVTEPMFIFFSQFVRHLHLLVHGLFQLFEACV